jgi:hypothetical protein
MVFKNKVMNAKFSTKLYKTLVFNNTFVVNSKKISQELMIIYDYLNEII